MAAYRRVYGFSHLRADCRGRFVYVFFTFRVWNYVYLHCMLSLAAQCIVIGPVCGGRAVFVGGWVCYHDNSKLRASIFNKLGL